MKAAFFLFAVLALPVHAQMIDGNKLHEDFKQMDTNTTKFGFLHGYVAAVHDSGAGILFCTPTAVNLGQITEMTRNYLENTPAIRHYPGDVIISAVLQKTWPCAKPAAPQKKGSSSL